jgi:hypothetical protein
MSWINKYTNLQCKILHSYNNRNWFKSVNVTDMDHWPKIITCPTYIRNRWPIWFIEFRWLSIFKHCFFYLQWGMLQQTVFINKTRTLRQTQRNTIGLCSTHMCMTCRAFPLWLQHQSSSLLSFVRLSYQFSSVICSV